MIGTESRQEVALGERDDAFAHAEQPQHVQVLRGLRHRPFVGSDAEHRHVDADRGRHHRAQEPLVARHVDDARDADAGQLQVRIARFEGDAARFFFRQPIGVDAGQRLYERGLAVVDVAGGPDDEPQSLAHSSLQPTPGARRAGSSVASPRRIATGAAQYKVDASARRPMVAAPPHAAERQPAAGAGGRAFQLTTPARISR